MSMMTITPQYLSLAKFLGGRLFRIPEYQRAYSWTTAERADLFGDIVKTHSKGADAGHFMAATACLRRGRQTLGADEFDVLEVVDGQQRLTTLTILFKAAALSLNREIKGEKKLAVEIDDLLVKPDGELLLLQTNHDGSHHFEKFLREGTFPHADSAKTLSDRELLLAFAECMQFVRSWGQAYSSLISLVGLLKNRLFFLLHEIDQEKAVYTVFEVLNSRGLDVSWIDRLKSILMGAAFELTAAANKTLISDLHTKWRDIYATIGLRQGMSTESLRFAATLWADEIQNRSLSEKASVDSLRSYAQDGKKIREVAAWLLDVVKACDLLAANNRINAVTRISHARLLAVSIHLRQDIPVNQKNALLAKWERITFRIYGMLGYDARTRVGDYVRLAWRVINEKLSVRDINSVLSDLGKDFTIDDAVDEIRNSNCYEGWERELRYFMYRYEEHLAKKGSQKFKNEQWIKIWMESPSESIEHILPQSQAPAKIKHNIGNLVLLSPGLNSKLQDDDPKLKSDAYRKTGLLIAGEVADSIDDGKWNKAAILSRQDAILEFARQEWAD